MNAASTQLLQHAAGRAIAYMDSLAERRGAPAPQALQRLAEFAEPLPEQPADPWAVLRRLDELGSPATVASAGPRFFGFVMGGALPVTVAANWLATAWDQNAALYAAAPAVAVLEEVALGWLIELLGLPRGTGGAFVTGATMANFTALAAARHAVLEQAGWDVDADGLIGAPPVAVVVGEEAHPSLLKALGLLGLGRSRVLRVPVDGQGQMRANALPRLRPPAIVCVQAGNVNTGAFDPIAEVCASAHAAGAWVHVDGAFGLWARCAAARAVWTCPIHSGPCSAWPTTWRKRRVCGSASKRCARP